MRILIAVSKRIDDECADPITAAASFFWPKDTEFQVLTVSETVSPPAMMDVVPSALDFVDLQKEADTAAKNIAVSAAARLQEHGWEAESVVVEGDPKSVIPDQAKQWGADLLVVGSCDRSRVEKFFLGSVSQYIVSHSPCSVLVVKPSSPSS